jgi:hypothetical protein
MGYSGRYHVASLAAVFIALAIGILIGAALGSDVVSGTAENLEQDLSEDLDQVRAENESLRNDLESERSFAERIVPALVADRLRGQEVAVIGFGDAGTAGLNDDVEAALEDSGAEITQVATVREPPDAEAIVDALLTKRERRAAGDSRLEEAAARAGSLLAGPDELPGDLRATLFSGFSGTLDGLDAAVMARQQPAELGEREADEVDQLERGLIRGLRDVGVRVVGAERTDADPSSIDFFAGLVPATVDNLDQLAGKVALVLALDGADGNFGVKETADSLLPDLIEPPVATGVNGG